jgi:hypothetical protein
MAIAQSRPDLQAHQLVVHMGPAEVAQRATDVLGARLVAYITGVTETRAVREWIAGDRKCVRLPRSVFARR